MPLARIPLACALLVAVALVGCGGDGSGVRGSGTTASEAREVGAFSKVRLQGGADMTISLGEPESVVVETDDNLLELLETDVQGDTLRIRFRDPVRETVGLDVTMTVPALEAVTVDGAADIEIDGMAGGSLGLTVNGAADIHATGSADLVDIDVNGAGVLRLFELIAEEVEISISGNGDVEVHATRSLQATLAGSGRVVYDGDPANVESSVTGAGSIERR